MARVDCIVNEVLVERHGPAARVVEWLTGHQQLLYVEIQPLGSNAEAKQTATGVMLREGQEGQNREELWSWTTDIRGTEEPSHGGELVFNEISVLEFALRVVASYMTLQLALALREPLELVGEARFKVSDDDKGSDIRVPLERNGQVCGHVAMLIKTRTSRQAQPVLPPATSKFEAHEVVDRWNVDDWRPFTDA